MTKYNNPNNPDTNKIERRFLINTETDILLDKLSLVTGLPRGRLIDMMTESMAAVYSMAVKLTGEKPDFENLEETISLFQLFNNQ